MSHTNNRIPPAFGPAGVTLVTSSPTAFATFANGAFAEWKPVGQTERDILHDMVIARWRIHLIRTFEAQSAESGPISPQWKLYEKKRLLRAKSSLKELKLLQASRGQV